MKYQKTKTKLSQMSLLACNTQNAKVKPIEKQVWWSRRVYLPHSAAVWVEGSPQSHLVSHRQSRLVVMLSNQSKTRLMTIKMTRKKKTSPNQRKSNSLPSCMRKCTLNRLWSKTKWHSTLLTRSRSKSEILQTSKVKNKKLRLRNCVRLRSSCCHWSGLPCFSWQLCPFFKFLTGAFVPI